jgi:hypothetical protein
MTLHVAHTTLNKEYESVILVGVNLFTLWKKENQAFSKQAFFVEQQQRDKLFI